MMFLKSNFFVSLKEREWLCLYYYHYGPCRWRRRTPRRRRRGVPGRCACSPPRARGHTITGTALTWHLGWRLNIWKAISFRLFFFEFFNFKSDWRKFFFGGGVTSKFGDLCRLFPLNLPFRVEVPWDTAHPALEPEPGLQGGQQRLHQGQGRHRGRH